jgi:hypothetical protein
MVANHAGWLVHKSWICYQIILHGSDVVEFYRMMDAVVFASDAGNGGSLYARINA